MVGYVEKSVTEIKKRSGETALYRGVREGTIVKKSISLVGATANHSRLLETGRESLTRFMDVDRIQMKLAYVIAKHVSTVSTDGNNPLFLRGCLLEPSSEKEAVLSFRDGRMQLNESFGH